MKSSSNWDSLSSLNAMLEKKKKVNKIKKVKLKDVFAGHKGVLLLIWKVTSYSHSQQ